MNDRADVCLVLEGTYPFVMGGVSAWIDLLVRQLPHLRFGVVHISPQQGYYESGPVYDVPENVAYVVEVGLLDRSRQPSLGLPARARKCVADTWRILLELRRGDRDALAELLPRVAELRSDGVHAIDLLSSRAGWNAVVQSYEEEAPDESFLNYFWNWRFAYQPLIELLFRRVPRAGMYHTVSTGYAGILAAAAADDWQRPMVLTEHGIYTKERRIEIYSADWIRDGVDDDVVIDDQAPFFRRFWARHFEAMSRFCYERARSIYTLYGANRDAQIADGADPERIEIIPNGVPVQQLAEAATAAPPRPAGAPFTVSFVGRVTPIKDVRTFIAAIGLVARRVSGLRARVLGPTGEDPEYFARCRAFASELGLDSVLRFEGPVDIREELVDTDVVVLTSISEAQPLVVLEAGAMGIPVVATNVGSCRELLEGRTSEDRALGIGGLLTPIASPGATARAVLDLHSDGELRRQMGRALQERVRRYYDQRDMLAAYDFIYQSCYVRS